MKERSTTITVIIADDHPVVLHGLAELLQATPDVKVTAVCTGGAAAIEAVRKAKPNIAVLDMSMPAVDGLQVLSNITANGYSTKVIFLTATASDAQILAAIAGGAKGIVLKEAASDELIDCIRAVAAGNNWFPAEVVEAAFERETGRRSVSKRLSKLTSRERQVIIMAAEGLSNKVIAKRLSVSEATVKIHLHNVYRKIGVANRTALAALAITHRDELVSGPQSKA